MLRRLTFQQANSSGRILWKIYFFFLQTTKIPRIEKYNSVNGWNYSENIYRLASLPFAYYYRFPLMVKKERDRKIQVDIKISRAERRAARFPRIRRKVIADFRLLFPRWITLYQRQQPQYRITSRVYILTCNYIHGYLFLLSRSPRPFSAMINICAYTYGATRLQCLRTLRGETERVRKEDRWPNERNVRRGCSIGTKK